MPSNNLHNIHILSQKVLITPEELQSKYPLSNHSTEFINHSRATISNIIHGQDHRLLAVVGPCSIHDIKSAKEYAIKLKALHDELKDQLFIVMRVYFEKPRTTTGWKGFLNDPYIDGSFDVEEGLHRARELLLWLAELELPVATEALDPISPQYLSELFSWSAIGARTTESQTHREMASGLSMPVGFKNGTDGNLSIAVNGLKSSASPHRFMGINRQGQVALLRTQGNPDGHIILRGGKQPNFDSVNIAQAENKLKEAGLNASLVIDCSHANSNKDFRLQPLVANNVVLQILAGNSSIIGIMLESHLKEGNQSDQTAPDKMEYGVSITDGCIDWDCTANLLKQITQDLEPVLKSRVHTNYTQTETK